MRFATHEALGRDIEAVVAGGGDGTVSAVAGVLAGSQVPLGILPLGTLNHFARDLGVPTDLDKALELLANPQPRAVDIGEVNGHFFVNNSSVGAYPRAVEERDAIRRRNGHGKQVAMVRAAIRLLFSRLALEARLEINGHTLHCRTPFVFVGNNPYSRKLLVRQLRPALDTGLLCILSPRLAESSSLARLGWHLVRNGFKLTREVEEWRAPKARIGFRRPSPRVAVDGEVLRLRSPLQYRIHPRALRVIGPSGQESQN